MVSNLLKKMIIFSSIEMRTTIENVVKCLALAERKSESAIIEQALTSALLSQNINAQYWIAELVSEGGCLWQAYLRVFCFLAAGLDWNAAEANGLPLVSAFHSTLSMHWPTLTGDETEIHHLIQQIESLRSMLPADDSDRNLADIMLHQLRDIPGEFYCIDLTGLILRHPDLYANHTRTYRALADIARLSAPTLYDTPITRAKYISTLRNVSASWKQ